MPEAGFLVVVLLFQFGASFLLARFGTGDGRRPGCAVSLTLFFSVWSCAQASEGPGRDDAGMFPWVIGVGGLIAGLAGLWLADLADQGHHGFAKKVAPPRAELLKELFALEPTDCEHLRFDGDRFWFGLSSRPYTSFAAARVGASQTLVTSDDRLPHSTSFRHTRMDGGPDGRYRHNPKTMRTCRVDLLLEGASGATSASIALYYYPGAQDREAKALAGKLNHFLASADAVGFEQLVSSYTPLHSTAARLTSEETLLRASIAEAQRVLEASKRIPADLLARDARAAHGRDQAQQTLRASGTRMREVRTQLDEVRARMRDLVGDAKPKVAPYREIDALRNYGAATRRMS